MNLLDSTKSLNYLKKIPEFYREVVKCWYLSGGGQTKSSVTFIDIRKQIIWENKHTVLLAEFSVLIVFIQFFGINLFTMLNSAIQLDLNFYFSRMNLKTG
jgi:hypothetical protein